MARRKRLFPKQGSLPPSPVVFATKDLEFGTKVRVIRPAETSPTKDLWSQLHEMYLGMEGLWHEVLDDKHGWMVVYFPDLQTGEVFMGDWLQVID